MSSIEGNFNRASRKYLTKIGYLTESRPQLFLNGEQLRGIAGQQRSNRKFEGFNEAAEGRQYFSKGKKNQWKKQLDNNQIQKIQDKFNSTMNKYSFKLS